jgi:hypothetical protein
MLAIRAIFSMVRPEIGRGRPEAKPKEYHL